MGLFGYTEGASIQNVGMVNVNITGRAVVGGLVGTNFGSSTINNCFSTGSVSNTFQESGGLVGTNYNSSSIINSFSTCSVSGVLKVGGLVGLNYASSISFSYCTGNVSSSDDLAGGLVGSNEGSSATINNCYSLGNVQRTTGTNSGFGGFSGYNEENIEYCYSTGSVNFGTNKGFVGDNLNGTYTNNFFDQTTSGQTTSIGATATTTANMKIEGTFTGWDFGSDNTDWVLSSSITFAGYPTLRWTGGYSVAPTGTPKEIATLPNLVWISENSSRWADIYTQTANIVTWTTPSWDGNKGWTPIGNPTTSFSGSFNGNNFTISNIFINRSLISYVGFFGYLTNSSIQNLGILNGFVSGFSYVGSLVGYSFSSTTINNCYSTGVVYGGERIGGLVGQVSGSSSISNSYSTCNVISSSRGVGGLVGFLDFSMVDKSFASGNVTGYRYVGGLIGVVTVEATVSNSYSICNIFRISGSLQTEFGSFCGSLNSGEINNGYSIGNVTYIGTTDPSDKGFCGSIISGTTSNNFWDNDVSNQSTALGATAETTAQMKAQSTFTNWDFSTIWNLQSGTYISYPYVQGITYDTPGASPEVNPIPGLEEKLCENTVNVDASYNSGTPGWGVTHFSDLSLALAGVCAGGTVNIATISNTAYSGDVSFDGLTVILGDFDFELTGKITSGFIRTTEDGKLVMKNLTPGEVKTFPITDGTYDFTVTINIPTASNEDIGMNIIGKQISRTLSSKFVVIDGNPNLNATMTMRVDKSSIAPKTINSTSNLRYFNSTKNRYVPYDGNKVSIQEFDHYYIITVANVNEF